MPHIGNLRAPFTRAGVIRWLGIGFAILSIVSLWRFLVIWRHGTVSAQPLTSDTAMYWLTRHPTTVVIDVRTPWEYQAGHIPGAISQPLGGAYTPLVTMLQDRPVLLVCQHGPRSRLAAGMLARAGVRELYELAGG